MSLKIWTKNAFIYIISPVDEKLISCPKKEMGNSIRAKFEDYNPGKASQKALRAVQPFGRQDTVI